MQLAVWALIDGKRIFSIVKDSPPAGHVYISC